MIKRFVVPTASLLAVLAVAVVPMAPANAQTAEQVMNEQAQESSSNNVPAAVVQGFDSIVYQDSQSWVFNRYDQGSMHNVQVLARVKKTQSVLLYGEYTYNGGSQGWVKALFTQGNLTCLEFWDFQGQCRPLGRSPSQGIALGIVRGIITSEGSDSGNGRNCDGQTGEGCTQKQIDDINEARFIQYQRQHEQE